MIKKVDEIGIRKLTRLKMKTQKFKLIGLLLLAFTSITVIWAFLSLPSGTERDLVAGVMLAVPPRATEAEVEQIIRRSLIIGKIEKGDSHSKLFEYAFGAKTTRENRVPEKDDYAVGYWFEGIPSAALYILYSRSNGQQASFVCSDKAYWYTDYFLRDIEGRDFLWDEKLSRKQEP